MQNLGQFWKEQVMISFFFWYINFFEGILWITTFRVIDMIRNYQYVEDFECFFFVKHQSSSKKQEPYSSNIFSLLYKSANYEHFSGCEFHLENWQICQLSCVKIFCAGNFWLPIRRISLGGNYPGGNCADGNFAGRICPDGTFLGWEFSRW